MYKLNVKLKFGAMWGCRAWTFPVRWARWCGLGQCLCVRRSGARSSEAGGAQRWKLQGPVTRPAHIGI